MPPGPGLASPFDFINAANNMAAFYVAKLGNLRARNLTVTQEEHSFEWALHLAAADDPEAVAHFSAQIEREAVRLSRIVADLLDLSRLESGSELSERVPLHALVREEAQRAHDQAWETDLTLEVRTDEDIWVDGSLRDLSLLIRNLIDNAIRYTPDESECRALSRDGPVRMQEEDP